MSPEPDQDVVAALIRGQAPQLADLPVQPSPASGSSNWVFRLGESLSARLPRTDDYANDLRKEVEWLPRIASSVPTPVPEVVLVGELSELFPRPWAVLTWLPGDLPGRLDAEAQDRLAGSLGAFVRGLHEVDAGGVPSGPEHWGYRCGEPVTDESDAWLEEAADLLADLLDPGAVRRAWRLLRDVPPPTAAPCWVHTDLSAENLLVDRSGGLAGVIDFGGLGVGDPSVDLLYAWGLLDPPARQVLRRAAGVDEATWLRARAWAFVGPGLYTIAGYRDTMPARTERLLAMVEAVADEVGVRLR